MSNDFASTLRFQRLLANLRDRRELLVVEIDVLEEKKVEEDDDNPFVEKVEGMVEVRRRVAVLGGVEVGVGVLRICDGNGEEVVREICGRGGLAVAEGEDGRKLDRVRDL